MLNARETQPQTPQERKIRLVALKLAKMMRDWPEMTWTDAQAVNRHVGFGKWHPDSYSGAADPHGGSGGILRTADLWNAWELAREIAREYP